MHEIYLIRNTFERIEEEFPEKSDRVSEIHLKVGLLSNVQPILITNAFKAFVIACTTSPSLSMSLRTLE